MLVQYKACGALAWPAMTLAPDYYKPIVSEACGTKQRLTKLYSPVVAQGNERPRFGIYASFVEVGN